MYKTFRYSVITLTLTILLFACSDPPTKPEPDPDSPTSPRAITPDNNDSGQETRLTLVWRSSDPNGDPLTYALYFGTAKPLPLLADNLTDTTYTLTGLRSNCDYYWKVVAADPDGNSTPSGIFSFATTDEYRFPLATGNRWGYEREQLSVGVDLSEWTGLDTLLVGTATMEVIGDTIFQDSIPLQIVAIEAELSGPRDLDEGRMYVRNTPNGRFTYAYEGLMANLTPGRLVPEPPVIFQGRRFNSVSELVALISDRLSNDSRVNSSIYFEDPPVVALKYPLEAGQRWTYRQGPEVPFRIDKRVEGSQSVENAAGKFDCTVVRWLYDWEQNGIFEDSMWIEDYLAPEGLVRRKITLLGVAQTGGYDNPLDTIALYDYFETYELADYNVE